MSTFKNIVNETVKEFLNEDEKRKFISATELFDALSTMKANAFICVGYMTVAKLNIPKEWDINPVTKKNLKTKHYNYSEFMNDYGITDEIGGIVKLSKYHRFAYVQPDDMRAKYKEYRNAKDAIKAKYGLPVTDKNSLRGKYASKQNFGDNGIDAYSGNNAEKMGNTYITQNVYNAQISSVYCVIDKEGNIIKTINKNDLKKYIPPYVSYEESAIRKLGKDEAEIKQFLDEIGELKMNYQKFENNKVLYVAAKSQEYGKFTFINTMLPDVIDGVKINTQQFVEIAAKNYNIDMSNLDSNI
jgi:hypothetical protein